MSEDITTRLRRDCMSLIADEAADEIDRIRAERDEARQRLCDIVVLVEAEQDQRTSKKHGHDISMLTSVKVVTTFLMTPEFVEDLYRVNKQYEHIGSIVAQTLKNAVDQKQGTDIRSIAIVRPMIARSLA
jgi:phosphotransacetylase